MQQDKPYKLGDFMDFSTPQATTIHSNGEGDFNQPQNSAQQTTSQPELPKNGEQEAQHYPYPFPPYRPSSLSLDTITTVTMPVLSPGNNGEAVRFLQQILISRGYHIVRFNANFDRYTYQGVLEFQGDHGLQVDGVVGWHTWRKLGEAIVANYRR